MNYSFYTLRVTVLGLLLLGVVASVYAQQEVQKGAVIFSEAAILCNDLDSAKQLADVVDPEAIEKFGQGLLKNGSCLIAGGVMQVKGLAYQGKTFNVIITHDTASQFYWVTVVKLKGVDT